MYKKAIMEKEEVIKNLRACLISSKSGVKVDDLNSKFFVLKTSLLIFKIIIIYLNLYYYVQNMYLY